MVECQDAHLDDLYQALSSTTRRRIVTLLAEQPLNISQLVPAFDMSLTAVSKHVKLLEKAGIVDVELKGRVHTCRLKPDALHAAYAWLGAYQGFWGDRLNALERVLIEDEQDDTRRI